MSTITNNTDDTDNSNNNNNNNGLSLVQDRARATLGMWAGVANHAVQQLTVKRYALPDKNVASQILMYRQLLHTKCRVGLKLSRDYQGTPAQNAVLHMPWWSTGIIETKKMIISYDNLIQRLWIQGAIIHPASNTTTSTTATTDTSIASTADTNDSTKTTINVNNNDNTSDNVDLLGTTFKQHGFTVDNGSGSNDSDDNNNNSNTTGTDTKEDGIDSNVNGNIDTLLDNDGLPPIPHEYWVSRLGFQQPDPVTDFRSGGVLSLAMMVWIVESCPNVYKRYVRVPNVPQGDASVLPFAITCINVTDMMSKFLMLAKSTDKMDTLLSQKPFWKMFDNPSSLLVCQELAMDMLADVVVELYTVRSAESIDGTPGTVSVFDFSQILSVTEKRVEYDLLGAGPTTVNELRTIHSKLKIKYNNQLQTKLQRIKNNKQQQQQQQSKDKDNNNNKKTGGNTEQHQQDDNEHNDINTADGQQRTIIPGIDPQQVKDEVLKHVSGFSNAATSFTGNLLSKIKQQQQSQQESNNNNEVTDGTTTASSSPSSLRPTAASISKRFLINPFNVNSNSSNSTSTSNITKSNTDTAVPVSTTQTTVPTPIATMDFFNDSHDTTTGTVDTNNLPAPAPTSTTDNNDNNNDIDFLLVNADEWIKTELGVDPNTVATTTTIPDQFSIGGLDDEEDLL